MRARQRSGPRGAVCLRPGAGSCTPQAWGPDPGGLGEPLAGAPASIRAGLPVSASRFRNHVRARPRFMGDFLPILPQGTRFCLGPRRTGLNESGIGQVSGSRSAAELTSARWSMSARSPPTVVTRRLPDGELGGLWQAPGARKTRNERRTRRLPKPRSQPGGPGPDRRAAGARPDPAQVPLRALVETEARSWRDGRPVERQPHWSRSARMRCIALSGLACVGALYRSNSVRGRPTVINPSCDWRGLRRSLQGDPGPTCLIDSASRCARSCG